MQPSRFTAKHPTQRGVGVVSSSSLNLTKPIYISSTTLGWKIYFEQSVSEPDAASGNIFLPFHDICAG